MCEAMSSSVLLIVLLVFAPDERKLGYNRIPTHLVLDRDSLSGLVRGFASGAQTTVTVPWRGVPVH